jgi:hypothetical protein
MITASTELSNSDKKWACYIATIVVILVILLIVFI